MSYKEAGYLNVSELWGQNLNFSNSDIVLTNGSNNGDLDSVSPTCQRDASADLKLVSWPRIRMLSSDPRCYAYDPGGGQHAVLYVIEEGIGNDPNAPILVSIISADLALRYCITNELSLGICSTASKLALWRSRRPTNVY